MPWHNYTDFEMACTCQNHGLWFPESQRTFANSMGAMGIQLGLLVTDVIGPLIVDQDANQRQFVNLSMAHLGFALHK